MRKLYVELTAAEYEALKQLDRLVQRFGNRHRPEEILAAIEEHVTKMLGPTTRSAESPASSAPIPPRTPTNPPSAG